MVVTEEANTLRPGDVIGQRCGSSYRVLRLLGEGGFGQVFLAQSELLAGQLAAVKVLLQDLKQNQLALARFRGEIYASGRIDKTHIVQVFDAGELLDGRLYMLMEYCSGGSLDGLIKERGPLDFSLVVSIASQVGAALDAAHEVLIVHRDVKPANILLIRDSGGPLRAKLCDFGIAQLRDERFKRLMLTGSKNLLGSPGYMSPEQCLGKRTAPVDHRTDIYSLASVIYEMVTGQRPYVEESIYALITNRLNNAPITPPSQLRRDLPPSWDWDRIILKGLSFHPHDRFETVREMIECLVRPVEGGTALLSYVASRLVARNTAPSAITISEAIGPAMTQWTTAFSEPRKRRRRFPRTLATVAAGALLGGGITAALMHFGGGEQPERITRDELVATATAGSGTTAVDITRAAQQTPSPELPRAATAPIDVSAQMKRDPAPAPVAPAGTAATPSGPPPRPDPRGDSPASSATRVAADNSKAPPHAPSSATAPLDPRTALPSSASSASGTTPAPAPKPRTNIAAPETNREAPLPRAAAGSAAVAPSPAPNPRRGSSDNRAASSAKSEAAENSKPAPRPDRPLPTAQVPAEPGTLRVEADPWATVTIDNESREHFTPVTIALPPGRHRVVLTKKTKDNPTPVKKVYHVTITSNDTTPITHTW